MATNEMMPRNKTISFMTIKQSQVVQLIPLHMWNPTSDKYN